MNCFFKVRRMRRGGIEQEAQEERPLVPVIMCQDWLGTSRLLQELANVHRVNARNGRPWKMDVTCLPFRPAKVVSCSSNMFSTEVRGLGICSGESLIPITLPLSASPLWHSA